MKKKCLIAIGLIAVLALSACGASPSQTPSDNNDNTKTDVTVSTGVDNSRNSDSNPTEDFLKTITAETAEAKGTCGTDLTWYYKDNVLVIKGTGAMTDYSGMSVHAPWNDYEDGKLVDKISWVIIDEGVTSIGAFALDDMKVVSKIELPNTMERIEERAFGNSNGKLEKLTIPASVTYIGDGGELEIKELTFLGDAPEGADWLIHRADKIYYSGNGFDEIIAKVMKTYPNKEWIKQ